LNWRGDEHEVFRLEQVIVATVVQILAMIVLVMRYKAAFGAMLFQA
jgi:hypothetical protein